MGVIDVIESGKQRLTAALSNNGGRKQVNWKLSVLNTTKVIMSLLVTEHPQTAGVP